MARSRIPIGSGGGPWRVFLIDAHSVLREGLRRLLEREGKFRVCGEAASGRTAVSLVAKARPDLVIIEIALPDANGLEIVKNLHARFPDLLMLVLSMHGEAFYAERALRAGAKGYILKQEPWKRLLSAIRKVLQNEIWVSESFSTRLLHGLVDHQNASSHRLHLLSDREIEIVDSIGQGLATTEIAGRLGISAKTVESHRGNIRRKLGLQSGPELMRFALASRASG